MSKEMISKQDRQGVRTASELERRWKFGKTFAEVMGMADEAQRAAEEAERAAEEATKELEELDQDAIFKLLTKDGELKGLFMKDGELYVNASYLATGVIKSENGKLVIDLSGGTMPTFNTGISTNGLVIRADDANVAKLFEVIAHEYHGIYHANIYLNSVTGKNLLRMTENFDSEYNPVGVAMELVNQQQNRSVKVDVASDQAGMWIKKDGATIGYFLCANDGRSWLQSHVINGKTVSWKDNGDGTFSLIGE